MGTPEGSRVVPTPYARRLLVEEIHISMAHVGAERVIAALRDVFWWPQLSK